MQAQTTAQATPMSNTQVKNSSWKTSVLYAILATLFLLALVAYGHGQGWLKQVGSKASDLIASTFPSMAKTVGVGSGVEDMLTKARAAYAAGNMNAAIAGYREIVASNPGDIAARGELGNVYYAVGMLPEAAQTYFDTASQAIEQNQLDIAEALVPAISEGSLMLAAQLDDKLFDAQMRADMAQMNASMQQPMQQQPIQQQPIQQQQQPMQQYQYLQQKS
jgi:hypothetical protein